MQHLLMTWSVLAFVLFTVGCQTAPYKSQNVDQGHWRARALVKDKDQSRSFIVNLTFNALRGDRLRLDVSSTLGHHVATLVSTGNDIKYVLMDSKRFYSGTPKPDVLRPILSVPLDPRWIQNILFEMPIEDKSWTCTRDKDGLLAECRDAVTNLSIQWANRKGEKRTVSLVHPKAEIQMSFHTFRPNVEGENLFQLEPPPGFQKFTLR